MRQLLTNGIAENDKKKKRESSKSRTEKGKRKKSKERRRSGSKADKADKKRRKELQKSLENLLSKVEKEKVLDGDAALNVIANNVEEKSPNSEEYQSNWDTYGSVDTTDMSASSMENLLTLDTIPLQLNVPKQNRSTLFINDFSPKTSEQFNQTTPHMKLTDPPVETPIILDFPIVKSHLPDLKDLQNGLVGKFLTGSATKLCDNLLEEDITPLEPIVKRNEPKPNQQPIAQLYDEYEQFIMSCMPTTEGKNHNNGDKSSSVASSLYGETITSNDGEEELEALKTSLEKRLNEIEHTDSEDVAKVKLSDQPIQIVKEISPKPPSIVSKESSESSSSSSSSSSSDSSSDSSSSSPPHEIPSLPYEKPSPMTLNFFNLPTGIEDDELSDNELMSKVEQLKQQFMAKLANKRKAVVNDSDTSEITTKADASNSMLLLSPEKRAAISLKIGGNKPNAILKPVILDDDDFTEKLMVEVTPNRLARAKETNKMLMERVIEPGVGLVSSSNSNSLASEIINTKVSRIGMLPNNSIVSMKLAPIVNAVVKNNSVNWEMKNCVKSDSSDGIARAKSGSIDSNMSSDSYSRKVSPTSQSRSDKNDSCDFNSKDRPLSPYHRSRTKETGKRHFSPPPHRYRSPRPRRRSSHRSPSPIRKRSRGSPRRSRSPRKSPRRSSPRRTTRRSVSPRSKRSISPIRGRPRTPPMPEKHANRKWEPPITDFKSLAKNVLACDNNEPQPICRLESTHSTSWSVEEHSAFAAYNYQHMQPLSPKRSLDDRIAHSFNHSDQSYDFHQANNGLYMSDFQYSTENMGKIPVLNSQENYYFRPPQSMQTLPPQQHITRQHVPPMHVQHMAPNRLSPQLLSSQHLPPPQRTFPNLIEIRQSNVEHVETTPFVVKGNVLEIVPKTEVVAEPLIGTASVRVEDESWYDGRQDMKLELTQEEIQRRQIKKAEMKLKRKQERDKRQLERFMRKEKLKLEIKHLMEVGAHSADIKKAIYNPNAIGGKSILRINASR